MDLKRRKDLLAKAKQPTGEASAPSDRDGKRRRDVLAKAKPKEG
jgi:hypothetical protein